MNRHKSKYLKSTSIRLFALCLLASAAFAQSFDASGNGMLKGAYFVRELLLAAPSGSSFSGAVSVIGTITFDGNGGYNFNGRQTKAGGATNVALSLNGTYQVSPSGFAIIQSIADPGDSEYGGVAGPGPNAFTASATEKKNLSIMVGVPAGSNASNSSLNGSWSAASMDFTNADINLVRNAGFNFTADGAGSMGNISVSGMANNLGGGATTQTVSGVTYTLSGNGGTANFGASSQNQLISGTKNIYLSADGNILVGGAPDGFDLLIATRSLTSSGSNSTASGVYYMAGLDVGQAAGLPATFAYNGSMNATGSGIAISHNREQSNIGQAFDNTSSSTFNVASDGTFQLSNNIARFTLGDAGQAFIATGGQGVYAIIVGFRAPQFSGSGVYLNPLGIVNAGSFAPATNPIAPGEIIAIFGSGLSSTSANAQTLPLPTDLGGASVTINGVKAPLFYVSSSQITAMVPYSISPANGAPYATVTVTSNGTTSNRVTMFTRNSSPGVFASSQNGIGPAAAEHADYSVITSSNPAHIGETIIIYIGGLGAVKPAVKEGDAAPSTPLSSATDPRVLVTFSGQGTTPPDFAGLTPTLAGLYQLNVKVPPGVNTGDAVVNVITSDGATALATIHVVP